MPNLESNVQGTLAPMTPHAIRDELIDYRIKLYCDWRKVDASYGSRRSFSHAVIHTNIEKRFGAKTFFALVERFDKLKKWKARVAKLADAPDLGSGGAILRGSSPLPGTLFFERRRMEDEKTAFGKPPLLVPSRLAAIFEE